MSRLAFRRASGDPTLVTMNAGPAAPSGWYADNRDPALLRWWDGQQWTEHTAPALPPPSTSTTVAKSQPVSRVVDAIATTQHFLSRRRQPTNAAELRTGRNPSIGEIVQGMTLEVPRQPLDEQVEVAGETYHIKGIQRLFRESGVPISSDGTTLEELQCILVPEPWNPYDPCAIAVAVGVHQVGYLPADLAAEYSEGLARLAQRRLLATGVARIWARIDGGMARARVTILIPESDAF
jgi:hypothetical protein